MMKATLTFPTSLRRSGGREFLFLRRDSGKIKQVSLASLSTRRSGGSPLVWVESLPFGYRCSCSEGKNKFGIYFVLRSLNRIFVSEEKVQLLDMLLR